MPPEPQQSKPGKACATGIRRCIPLFCTSFAAVYLFPIYLLTRSPSASDAENERSKSNVLMAGSPDVNVRGPLPARNQIAGRVEHAIYAGDARARSARALPRAFQNAGLNRGDKLHEPAKKKAMELLRHFMRVGHDRVPGVGHGRGAGPEDFLFHGQPLGPKLVASLPGIPSPVRSRPVLVAPGLGGVDAVFLAYEGWGSVGSIAEVLCEDFDDLGWRENTRVEELMEDELPGRFLSYTRGQERCMMYLYRVPESGRVETLAIYINKKWLPAWKGF